MAKSHQSVTMVELFYDLIFAYAVGRMAQSLAVPVHGMIAPQVLVEFLLMLLVFWTIWTFQTVLIFGGENTRNSPKHLASRWQLAVL